MSTKKKNLKKSDFKKKTNNKRKLCSESAKQSSHDTLWCPHDDKNLTESDVAHLYRCRIDIGNQPQPNVIAPQLGRLVRLGAEFARAASVDALRNQLLTGCQKLGLRRIPIGAWEKWHFHLLSVSGQETISKGDTALEDPVLPVVSHEQALMSSGLIELLVKESLERAEIPVQEGEAKQLSCNLLSSATEEATKLAKTLIKIEQDVCNGRHNPYVPKDTPRVGKPSKNESVRAVMIECGKIKLRINQDHFEKLQQLHEFHAERRHKHSSQEEFVIDLFILLLRHKTMRGGGFQAALTGHVFDVLRDTLDIRFECFASPFNCRYKYFCSAFPDTDDVFGSLGSFFSFSPTSGSFELNPPFVDTLILAMTDKLEYLLERANQEELALTFVIVVGANAASRKHDAWTRLTSSEFLTAQLLVKLKDHGYHEGDQHIVKDSVRLATCDTGVFFWQSKTASKQLTVNTSMLASIESAFRKSRPLKLKKTPKSLRRAKRGKRSHT